LAASVYATPFALDSKDALTAFRLAAGVAFGRQLSDLADHLAIIPRKAKRRSEAEQQAKEFERRMNPGEDE